MSPLPSINATSDASDLQDTMQNEAPLSSEAIGAVPDGGSCLSIQAQSLFRTAPLATSFVPFGDIPTKFLPQFPVLRGKSSQEPGPLITPTLIGTPNGMRDIQDIAKEAIRLTKETLFHQNHSRSAGNVARCR